MTGRFEADPGPFLRPYAMTEGRTEPTGPDLAIEDLVGSAGPGEPPSWLSLEHRSIATACRETLSVAELAARVDLPLGVTRVLVGDLAIEDLVGSAGPGEPPPWLSLEHRSIATACRETLSVAELAARVDLPLGVTRVLVGDLASQGMVTVHRAPSHTGGPNVALLEQVLHGLQRL
jgi:hypothetical protein